MKEIVKKTRSLTQVVIQPLLQKHVVVINYTLLNQHA